MTLPRFMRQRDGTPVEVLIQNPVHPLFPQQPTTTVVYTYVYEGATRIAYANSDGKNPSGCTPADLLPYETQAVAEHFNHIPSVLALAAARFANHKEYHNLAVDMVAFNAPSPITRADVVQFLKERYPAP